MLIERLIDAAIPLWNVTLAPLTDKAFNHQRRINYPKVEYDLDMDMFAEEAEDEYVQESRECWVLDERQLVHPEPEGPFRPSLTPSLDLKAEYSKRGLQVIVKLANIQLTPEKPDYEGETWHLEGRLVCTFLISTDRH
jgi:hypothetical protein